MIVGLSVPFAIKLFTLFVFKTYRERTKYFPETETLTATFTNLLSITNTNVIL